MKKNLFYTVMMMAVMAVVTISFTACGGGDDDPLTENNQNKQDPDDISAYIWPSTQWDCSMDDIKKYMASSSMVVTEERNGILIYQTTDRKYMIGYAADENNKYCSCQAVFTGYSQKKMNNIKEKVTKDYGMKLTNDGADVWRAYGTINGKYCKVTIYGMESSIAVDISVQY